MPPLFASVKQIVGVMVFATSFLFADAVSAGPALICREFDAGSARLLPWSPHGSGWDRPEPAYDVNRLTVDTLGLLSPEASILARMENMRRATIYAGRDQRVAADLLTAVLARAQSDSGRGENPLAWFDAGYLVESFRQATYIHRWDMLEPARRSAWTLRHEPTDVDGYAMVLKALRLLPSPEMEFAASMMKEGAAGAGHRRRAAAGATTGSLLARNLATP